MPNNAANTPKIKMCKEREKRRGRVPSSIHLAERSWMDAEFYLISKIFLRFQLVQHVVLFTFFFLSFFKFEIKLMNGL